MPTRSEARGRSQARTSGWLASLLFLQACATAAPPAPPSEQERAAIERDLARKAASFHRAIHARHLTDDGLFLYVVDLARIEEQLASGTTPALADTPTYTGLFAAMSCTRARASTGSERLEALGDASRALAGLHLLMRVTGHPGLLARGVQRGAPPAVPARPHHRWFPGAAPHEEYAWRGDASQDQYANGLLPAVAECRELLPEPTRELIRDAAELLLSTQMKLIDPDGRQTTYGDLSPRSGLGWNSIGKLTGYAVFALASELDADPRWEQQRRVLRDEQRVVATSTRTNLRIAGITNFSNDLMAFDLYRVLVPLARRTGDPALGDLLLGLERAWRRVRADRSPYFTLLYCGLAPEGCTPSDRGTALRELAAFPLEKRRLAPSPELARIPRAWLPGRHLHRHAREVVPIELRPPSSFEWKSSPYRIDGATVPTTEYTGLDFLCAYWLHVLQTRVASLAE